MPELSDPSDIAPDTAYDAVPYPGRSHPQSHPDRLATIATLFGLEPPPPDKCRMLELGCGDGSNLLPVAYGAPGAQCVGIDLAAVPVARGMAVAQALGLGNVSLRQLDVVEVTRDFGEFDYIIAHGLFAWVPGPVREKVLDVCRQNLSPNGVAYVSYNAYPGCHVRQMVREMMRFHVARFADPRQKVEQAKGLLKLLAEAREPDDPWGRVLRWELERVGPRDPGALFHDDLADVNEPYYVTDFAAEAGRHGLQYLAEADFGDTQYVWPDAAPGASGPAAEKEAGAMAAVAKNVPAGNVLAREQYGDFLRGRGFRQTLLCHAGVRVERPASPRRVATLYAASQLRPASKQPDVRSNAPENFVAEKGPSVTVQQPVVKAALVELAERRPRSIPFDELLARARERAGASAEQDPGALCMLLYGGFGRGVIALHSHVPPFVTEPGERPAGSALARHEAASSEIVTSMLGARVRLEDPLARALLPLLDGTRDRPALAAELLALTTRAGAFVEHQGRRVSDPAEVERLLRELLDERLRSLGRLALLVA